MLNEYSSFITTYPKHFLLKFIPSILVVFAYAYIYEYMKEEDQKQISLTNNQKNQLDIKVKEQTAQLKATNKALAKRIEQHMFK